jgi:phospholipid/cholesterol/gamma-HCH transport system substrate-binding protein
MSSSRRVEFVVGLFIIASVCALFFLAFRVSGMGELSGGHYYTVKASFDNIGDLKVSAPVTVAGVRVGEVSAITLDPETLQAQVAVRIQDKYLQIPLDSSASILTQGLLGSNYIGMTPGFDSNSLHDGSVINTTHSAVILENIIGQLIYSMKGDSGTSKKSE